MEKSKSGKTYNFHLNCVFGKVISTFLKVVNSYKIETRARITLSTIWNILGSQANEPVVTTAMFTIKLIFTHFKEGVIHFGSSFGGTHITPNMKMKTALCRISFQNKCWMTDRTRAPCTFISCNQWVKMPAKVRPLLFYSFIFKEMRGLLCFTCMSRHAFCAIGDPLKITPKETISICCRAFNMIQPILFN